MLKAESRGEKAHPAIIGEELGNSAAQIEEAFIIAQKEGLVVRSGADVRLTPKGRAAVLRHREQYVHDKYVHRPSPRRRISTFLGGNIKDWRLHWHSRHGLDDQSLDRFYQDIRSLQGRVENTVPLIQLGHGKRGVVAFALGGRGAVQRLAEMGLTPGAEVVVIREAPFHGPLQISVRGVSLALGYGIASKVFVRPLE